MFASQPFGRSGQTLGFSDGLLRRTIYALTVSLIAGLLGLAIDVSESASANAWQVSSSGTATSTAFGSAPLNPSGLEFYSYKWNSGATSPGSPPAEGSSWYNVVPGNVSTTICDAVLGSTIDFQWGSLGPSRGSCDSDGSDYINDKFVVQAWGYITIPAGWTSVQFCGRTDDGSTVDINVGGWKRVLGTGNWIDQGSGACTDSNRISSTQSVTPGAEYEFRSWFYENGGGANFQVWWRNGSSGTWALIPSANLRPWLAATLDAYGGTFAAAGTLPAASTRRQVFRWNSSQAISTASEAKPTRNGYVFSGWATSKNGSAVTSLTLTNQTTLYARWTPEISWSNTSIQVLNPAAVSDLDALTSVAEGLTRSYSVQSSGTSTCSISGKQLSALNYGSCRVRVSVASNDSTTNNLATSQDFDITIGPMPSAPVNPLGNSNTNGIVVTANVAGELNVTWGTPLGGAANINGYQVEYSTDGSNWVIASASVSSTARSFNITGLTEPGPYYVRVAAKTSAGLGAYGYPWTEIYRTTNAQRNSSGAFDYAVNRIADRTYFETATSFTRVRYEMSRTVSNVKRFVFTDFNKSVANVPANLCTNTSCTTSDLSSLGKLQVPSMASGAQLTVSGDVSDLTVYSDEGTVSNGAGLTGHLELWPWNYVAEQAPGVTGYGSSSFYDSNDRPSGLGVGTNNYGSFQLHDITSMSNPRTVFAWNRHALFTNNKPEVGIGTSPYEHADWTFCSTSSNPAPCGVPTEFQMSILVNMPVPVLRTVTFNANFGTTPATATQLVKENVATQLTKSPLSRTDYSFVKWTTNSNGAGTSYNDGDTITVSTDLTLYAQWELAAVTVSYAAGGGSGSVPAQETKTVGETITVASGATLYRDGYTFSGWTSSSAVYQPGDTYTVGTDPVTFTARWLVTQTGFAFTSSNSMTYGDTKTVVASGGQVTTGSVTYELTANPNGACRLDGNILSAIGVGTCEVSATKPGDSTYASLTIKQTISVGKATLTITPTNITNVTYGDVGVTPTSYTVSGLKNSDTQLSIISSVSLNRDSGQSAGSYSIRVTSVVLTSTGLSFYVVDTNTVGTYTINKKAITVTAANKTKVYLQPNPTFTYTQTGTMVGSDTFTVTFAAIAQDVAVNTYSITPSLGQFTSGDPGNYNITFVAGTLTVTQASQPSISFTNAMTATYGDTVTLTLSEGSTSTTPVFRVVSGVSFCSISGSVLTAIGVGQCTIEGERPADSNYFAAYTQVESFTVTARPLTIRVQSKSKTYGDATPTFTSEVGGSGLGLSDEINAITYVFGASETTTVPTDAGTYVLKASAITLKNGRSTSNYSITFISATYTINLKTPTISLSSTTLSGVFAGQALTLPTASSASTGAFTWATSDSGVIAVNGTTLTIAGAGTATLTVTQAALGNYDSATATVSVTISKANQAALRYTGETATVYGQSVTLTLDGGTGGGAESWSFTSGPCSLTGAVLRTTGAGTCVVVGTKAGGDNYFDTSTASISIAVAPAPLTIKANNVTKSWDATAGTTFEVTKTGLVGSDNISSVTITFTGINGTTYSASTSAPTAVGTYRITPSAAVFSVGLLSNYAVTYDTGTYTISKAIPVLTGGSSKTVVFAPNATAVFDAVTSSVTSATAGAITYSSSNPAVATVADTTKPEMTIVGAGSAELIATQAATDTHEAVQLRIALTVDSATQTTAIAVSYGNGSASATVTYGDSLSFVVSGGDGTGAYVLTVSDGTGACLVVGSQIKGTKVGTCQVRAIRQADNNYLEAAAFTESFTVTARTLTIGLSVVSTVYTGSAGTSPQIQATGLATGDAISSVTRTWSGEGLATSQTTAPSAAGSYTVQASDVVFTTDVAANYTISYDAAVSYTITQASAQFAWGAGSGTPIVVNVGASSVTLTTTSDPNATGEVSFSSNNTSVASVDSAGVVTFVGYGSAVISAVKAATQNYAGDTVTVSVTVNRLLQVSISVSSASSVQYGSTLTLTTTGGSSNEAVTFTLVSGQQGPCQISGSSLTATGVGTCKITATMAGNASYEPVTSAQFTIQVDSKPITVSLTAVSISYGASAPSPTCSVSGVEAGETVSSCGRAFPFTNGGATPTNVGVYVVRPTNVVLSANAANYVVNVADTSNYEIVAVAPVFTATGGTWTLANVTYGASPFAPSGLTSNNPAPILYSSSNPNIATWDSATGLLTIVGAGTTTITARQTADSNFLEGSTTTTLTVLKAAQSTLSVTSKSAVYGTNYTLVASGGSGDGAISWAVISFTINGSGQCTIANGVLSTTGAGQCVVRATRAESANYLSADSANETVTVAARPLTISAVGQTITYGETPDDFTFTLSGLAGNDTISSVTWTYSGSTTRPTAVGTYDLLPESATFSTGLADNYDITYVKADYVIERITLEISGFEDITKNYLDANFDLVGPTTNSSGSITFTSSDISVATIIGRTVTVREVGSTTIRATVAQTATHDGGYIEATLTVNQIAQATFTLTSTAASYIYGNQFVISFVGSSGTGQITVTPSGPCSVVSSNGSSATLTSSGIGTCSLNASRASDRNYLSASSATALTITISKRDLTLTVNSATKAYGAQDPAFSATTSGLANNDSLAALVWKVNGSTSGLPSDVGVYELTLDNVGLATGQLSNYNVSVIPSSYSITAISATHDAWSITTVTYGTADITPTAPTSNSAGSWSYSSSAPGVVSIVDGKYRINGAGTATITATQASAGNYAQTASTATLTVIKANQASLQSSALTITYGDVVTLSATGGSGTGAYTFTTSGSVCSISGSTLTAIGAGACTITVGRNGDSNYELATTITASVTVAKKMLTVTAVDKSKNVGGADQTPTATVSGLVGSDSFASFTYLVDGIASTVALPQSAGNYTIAVSGGTFSGPNNSTTVTDFYNVTYNDGTYSVGRIAPTIQTWTLPNATYGTSDITPTAPTSNSTGAWTYSSSNISIVSIVDGKFHVISGGSVTITATQAAAGDYTSGSVTATLTIDKAAQPALTVNAVTGMRHGDTVLLSISGGSGAGAITFNWVSGPCTISDATLTATGAGSCVVTATKATDSNYLATTSVNRTITIAARPITVTVDDATIEVGAPTPTFTATVTGAHAGVEVSDMTLLFDGDATTPTQVGSYVMTINTVQVSGGNASDYVITTASGTYTIASKIQAALILSGPSSVVAGSSITMTVTGGSGTGAVSLTVVTGTCQVSGLQVRGMNSGSCQVRALKAADATYAQAQSLAVTINVSAATNPNAISSLSLVTIGGDAKRVTWSGSPKATVKVVDRNGQEVAKIPASKGEVDLSGLTPGRRYNVTVEGDSSSWTTGFVVPVAAPVAVTATAVRQSEQGLELTLAWEQPGYAEQFRVTITPKGGVPISITTKDKEFEITALPGKEYSVTVVAMGEDGQWGTAKTFTTRAPGASGSMETPLRGDQIKAVSPVSMTSKSVVLKTNSDSLGALQLRVSTNGKTQITTCFTTTCAIAAPSAGMQVISTMAIDPKSGLLRAMPLAAIVNVSPSPSRAQRAQLFTLATVGIAEGGRVSITGSGARAAASALRAGGFEGKILIQVTRARTTSVSWRPS